MLAVRGIVILYAALATLVHGHGLVASVQGANGVNGVGMGVVASTPPNGEADVTIINDKDIASGKAEACGRTVSGGNNDIATNVEAASNAGLASIAADGTVSMTLHQVNGDGAGPYTCEISTDATGATFTAMTITTNVPGTNGNSNAKATDFPLVAKAPAGTTCTGGPAGDACIVRCRNPAAAGPFGGCVVVTSAGSGNSAATNSAATTGAAVVADKARVTGTHTVAAAASTETAAADGKKKHKHKGKGDKKKGDKQKSDKQKNMVARFFDYFNKREDSRKRIVRSRIVEEQKRGLWI